MSDVRSILAPDGPLAAAMPGFESRAEQLRMASEIHECFASGRHLLVEAGTGIGKSFAYLVPAVLWATRREAPGHDERRIVISTHTRALQEQLARKDLPLLERALLPCGIEFRHSLLMGSENYLCVQRLSETALQAAELFDQPSTAVVRALQRHAGSAPSGLRSEIPFAVPGEVWNRVKRDRDICLGPRGPFWDSCLYRRDLERSREAHLLVVNHALFLLDLATGGRILPPHRIAVLDEAHRIEDVALSQFGTSVSDRAVARLLSDIDPQRHSDGRRGNRSGRLTNRSGPCGLRPVLRAVEESAATFFDEVAARVAAIPTGRARGDRRAAPNGSTSPVRVQRPGLAEDRVRGPLEDLERRLDAAGKEAATPIESLSFSSLASRARVLRERIGLFLTQRLEDAVYWVETASAPRRGVTLRVSPVEVAPILRQHLFEGGRTVAMTSATLTAAGSFAHIRRRLGVTAAHDVALGSPFDFREQALLYLPDTMPDPVSDPNGYSDAVVTECRRLLLASDGGAFLLFTSYALLRQVHDALACEPVLAGLRLFRHEPGAASSILEDFRMTRRGVLLGTMTFWQGVDVPGDALRCVIITRLPFDVPDQPLTQARAEMLRARGLDPFLEDALPDAVLTFRQGFGRLIRSREDRGLVAVLDPRARTRPYGAAFLESIPSCPQTGSIEEVRRFYDRAVS